MEEKANKKEQRKEISFLIFKGMLAIIVIVAIGFGSYLIGVKTGIERKKADKETNISSNKQNQIETTNNDSTYEYLIISNENNYKFIKINTEKTEVIDNSKSLTIKLNNNIIKTDGKNVYINDNIALKAPIEQIYAYKMFFDDNCNLIIRQSYKETKYYKYNITTNTFEETNIDTNYIYNIVNTLYDNTKGYVILTTESNYKIAVYENNKYTITNNETSSNNYNITLKINNNVIKTDGKNVYINDNIALKAPIEQIRAYKMYFDEDNNLIVSQSYKETKYYKYNLSTNTFEETNVDTNKLSLINKTI